MKRYARKAGILSITSGIAGIVYIFSFLSLSIWIMGGISTLGSEMAFLIVVYSILLLYFIIFGSVSIIGGVYALRSTKYYLALAGAICGIFAFFPTAIPALINILKAKSEFNIPPHN